VFVASKRSPVCWAIHVDSLVILWRQIAVPRSASLANDDGCDIDAPDNGSDDCVCDQSSFRVLGKHESEATVDNTKGDDDAANPDVGMRESGASLELLEIGVVESSEDWLEEHKHEDEYADNGMVGINLILGLVTLQNLGLGATHVMHLGCQVHP
jgi:hypothetical protein